MEQFFHLLWQAFITVLTVAYGFLGKKFLEKKWAEIQDYPVWRQYVCACALSIGVALGWAVLVGALYLLAMWAKMVLVALIG